MEAGRGGEQRDSDCTIRQQHAEQGLINRLTLFRPLAHSESPLAGRVFSRASH